MTIEERCKKHLEECGMFPDQAQAVLDQVTDEDIVQWTQRRSDDLSGYEDISGSSKRVMAVILMALSTPTLRWIDANLPKAWYRPMFDPEQMKEIQKAVSE